MNMYSLLEKITNLKKLLFTSFLIFILLFTISKIYVLNKYPIKEDQKLYNSINITDSITIKTTHSSNITYLNNKNISFPLLPNFYKMAVDNANDTSWYTLGDNNNTTYSYTSTYSYTNILMNPSKTLSSFSLTTNLTNIIKKEYLPKFLVKKKITNDLDLIKYIEKHGQPQNNLFTSFKRIKINYFLNSFLENSLPNFENITEIKGSLTGYILNNDKYRIATILKNNKIYSFTFFNTNYFTDQVIIDFLNNISIQ